MLKFTENFSMTFAENRTYGVPEFAGTEVNRHSDRLKGLSGYLKIHHDTMVGDKTQPQTIRSSAFIWKIISSTYVSFHSRYNRSPNKKSSRYNGTAKKQLNPCLSLWTVITSNTEEGTIYLWHSYKWWQNKATRCTSLKTSGVSPI